jgi:HEPN domain-containing protein
MKWTRGGADVEQLIADGRLEPVTGAAADGSGLLRSAEALLSSARREREHNPEAAYVLAYDAARKAATALLAQQGLRPRSVGHHVTVETAVKAQFGGPFDSFGLLRRRRGEIEYPQRPGDDIDRDEADEAILAAARITEATHQLLAQLDLYR